MYTSITFQVLVSLNYRVQEWSMLSIQVFPLARKIACVFNDNLSIISIRVKRYFTIAFFFYKLRILMKEQEHVYLRFIIYNLL